MKRQKDEKWLDELISRTINTTKPEFDVEKWKHKYPEEFQMLLSRARQPSPRQPNIWRTILKSPITKLAAAAVLLIGVGYTAGRLSSPPPDMKQLRSDIYQSVLEQVNRDQQSALANIRLELKDELNQELRRDLNDFGVRILAASGTVTNQLLIKLIQSIDAAQTKDRRWVMAALDQIEFNRLQDAALLRKDVELLIHPGSGRPTPDVPENSNLSNERSKK